MQPLHSFGPPVKQSHCFFVLGRDPQSALHRPSGLSSLRGAAGQGRGAPAAKEVSEGQGGAGLVDLQPALVDGGHG